ncbi:hypothetical protein GB937_005429 [Aspergillus fischeri]|nr:hypothetical protein GB937_005429 [Aspergillus fischeri]
MTTHEATERPSTAFRLLVQIDQVIITPQPRRSVIDFILPHQETQIPGRVIRDPPRRFLLVLHQINLRDLNRPSPCTLHDFRNLLDRPRITCNVHHLRNTHQWHRRQRRHRPPYILQSSKRHQCFRTPHTLIPVPAGIKPKPRPDTILQKQPTEHPAHLHLRDEPPRKFKMPLLLIPFPMREVMNVMVHPELGGKVDLDPG